MGGGGFLGLGPAPSAPAAPDYTGAAQATAAGNVQAAQTATAANRVNQVTPYGNLNYAETGTDSQGNPTWTATTSLSDVGQQLLNTQNNASLGLGSAISSQLGQVQNVMGQGFNPQTGPITTNIGQANLNPLTGQANLQTQTDYAGGMAGWDKANQLLMSRLQPQMDIQNKNLDAQLANQGLAAGTEAYNRAKSSLGMQQNDLLNQAQLSGLSAGNTLFNQGLAGAQFGNAAQQQGYQNQQAQQQGNNALAQQQFGNQLTNANLGNAAQQQQYAQNMGAAQFGNSAVQQSLAQQSALRSQPLNEILGLMGGSQIQLPQFQGYQGASVAAAPSYNAVQQQYQGALGRANAQNAANNSLTSGLFNLGGSALMAPTGTFGGIAGLFSDRRLKTDIKQVGTADNGLNIYSYKYVWGGPTQLGYMADEVEKIMPQAVGESNGYKTVNYGMI